MSILSAQRICSLSMIAILGGGFVSLGSPAAAAVPKPSGTISCTFAGTAALNPALTATASGKALKFKATATSVSCNNAGVAGGKAPITAAAVKITGSLAAGSECGSLASPTFGKTKIQAKWQGLNPTGKLMTVAVNNVFLASASMDLSDPGEPTLQLVSALVLKGAFANQTITLRLVLDSDFAELMTTCSSPTGLSSIEFGLSNVVPSSITSP